MLDVVQDKNVYVLVQQLMIDILRKQLIETEHTILLSFKDSFVR